MRQLILDKIDKKGVSRPMTQCENILLFSYLKMYTFNYDSIKRIGDKETRQHDDIYTNKSSTRYYYDDIKEDNFDTFQIYTLIPSLLILSSVNAFYQAINARNFYRTKDLVP